MWSRNLEHETLIDMLHNVETAGDGKRKRREEGKTRQTAKSNAN